MTRRNVFVALPVLAFALTGVILGAQNLTGSSPEVTLPTSVESAPDLNKTVSSKADSGLTVADWTEVARPPISPVQRK